MPNLENRPLTASIKVDPIHNLEMHANLATETAEVVNLVDGKNWTDGGGGGVEFESGTITPEVSADSLQIDFANEHEKRPNYVFFGDASPENIPVGNNAYIAILNYSDNPGIYSAGTVARAGTNVYGYVSTANLSGSTNNVSDAASLNNVLTPQHFIAKTNSTNEWKAGRIYKWFAIWA